MKKIKVAGAALNQTPLDWEGNLANIAEALRQARAQQAEFLALPELCICGYNCDDLFLSTWLYEKAEQQLLKVVPLTENITVSLGLPVLFKGQNLNCVAVISDRRLLGITAKQFLANDGVHYEKRWFSPWPKNLETEIWIDGEAYPFGDIIYEAGGIKIGIEVCEDAWQGENRPGVQHHLRGAHLIMVNNASHFSMGKTATRADLVLLGSLEFRCSYIYVNLLGNESGRTIYDGEILIAENGELIQRNNKLSFLNVDLVFAELNLTDPPVGALPNLDFDELDKNNEFIKAASLGMFDYLRKSRSRGFVLSLSGGADSALCAVLVAEMVRRGVKELGFGAFIEKLNMAGISADGFNQSNEPEKNMALVGKLLTCAYQGTVNSSDVTFNAAKTLAESIGATFYSWNVDAPIEHAQKTIETAIGRKLSWHTDDIALQNIQARSRSPLIWMLANLNNALLITTSNRSEADTGYATMDGDTSGSLAPIAGVDKAFVRQWLRWAEKELGYTGLARVNAQAPTAELRPTAAGKDAQTDEADLMPYDIMVRIEREAILFRRSPLQVFRELSGQEGMGTNIQLEAYISKFFRLWAQTQWKRERYAPSFHLDDFNVDPRSWCRFPILSGGFRQELEELKAYAEQQRALKEN